MYRCHHQAPLRQGPQGLCRHETAGPTDLQLVFGCPHPSPLGVGACASYRAEVPAFAFELLRRGPLSAKHLGFAPEPLKDPQLPHRKLPRRFFLFVIKLDRWIETSAGNCPMDKT